MKKIAGILLVTLIVIFVFSCKKDESTNSYSYIGKWTKYTIYEDSVGTYEVKELLDLSEDKYSNTIYIKYDNEFLTAIQEKGSLTQKDASTLTFTAETYGDSYDTITNKYTGNLNVLDLTLYYTISSRTYNWGYSVTKEELIVYFGDINYNGRTDADEYDTYLKMD